MVLETRNSADDGPYSSALTQDPTDSLRDPRAIQTEGQRDPLVLQEEVISVLERLIGQAEFVAAREEFFWKTGKVFVDDSFYEQRTNYFLDHFFYVRPLSNEPAIPPGFRQITPLSGLLKHFRLIGSNAQLVDALSALSRFRHSVYEIAKASEKALLVRDMVTGEKINISTRQEETFIGLRTKDIFQGFLLPYDSDYVLSRGLIFHPPPVLRILRKFLKLALKSDDFSHVSVLYRLASVQLRHLRHRHVEPAKIYCTELIPKR